MGDVVVSVDINAPNSKVFELVKDIEKVIHFMPAGWEVSVERLSQGPIEIGSKFHVSIKKGFLTLDYVEEIVNLDENKEVHSKSVDGFDFNCLRWIIEPSNDTTRLTRHVKFRMPYSFIGSLMEKLWAEKTFENTGKEWLQKIKRFLEA